MYIYRRENRISLKRCHEKQMQINTASNQLAVFWALLELRIQNISHSIKNIADLLQGQLSRRSIEIHLDTLEKYRAIIHPRPHGKRQGIRKFFYKLDPYYIPSSAYTAKAARSTKHNHRASLAEVGVVRYEKGILVFDPEKLLELTQVSHDRNDFLNSLSSILQALNVSGAYPDINFENKDESKQWFIKQLRSEEWDDDSNFLEFFYGLICFRWLQIYVSEKSLLRLINKSRFMFMKMLAKRMYKHELQTIFVDELWLDRDYSIMWFVTQFKGEISRPEDVISEVSYFYVCQQLIECHSDENEIWCIMKKARALYLKPDAP